MASETDVPAFGAAPSGRAWPVLRDLGVRAAGLALLAVALVAIRWLPAPIRAIPHPVAAGAYLDAAIAFLCSSAGGALVCLGARVHDRVLVSERWRAKA